MHNDVPLLDNIYLGQIIYGAAVGYLALRLYEDVTAGGPIPRSAFFLTLGIVVATLLFAVYLRNMHRFGVTPDYSEVCEWCGGPVNSYSEFCEHCGLDLVYGLVECPGCGVDVAAGQPDCPECGADLPEPDVPEEYEQAGDEGDDTHYHA